MKHLIILTAIFGTLFSLTSCGDEEINKTIESPSIIKEEAPVQVVNENSEITAADTSSTGVYQEEINEEEQTLQNVISKTSSNEMKEEGMSFCDCVKKNQKLSDTMMSDETSDNDFDIAMNELELMKKGPCKIMFPQQNNIEEQELHRQKVKNCLNN